MKFHLPSFKWYFEQEFDGNYDVWWHGWTGYIETVNRFLSLEKLNEIICRALVTALDAPCDAPDGPRQRSLLDAPIDAHVDAVQDALREPQKYLRKWVILTSHGERYQWQVDLRVIQSILITVRRDQDVLMVKKIISENGGFPISQQLLGKLILHRVGVCFSNRRVRQVATIIKNNGFH
jgi:hypothetical protein